MDGRRKWNKIQWALNCKWRLSWQKSTWIIVMWNVYGKKIYLCGIPVKRWKALGVVQQQGGTTRASITNRYLTPQSFYLLSFKE
jgi:hypothetical protein